MSKSACADDIFGVFLVGLVACKAVIRKYFRINQLPFLMAWSCLDMTFGRCETNELPKTSERVHDTSNFEILES